MNTYLVGGLEHLLFSIIYGIMLPIDQYLIFFKMVKTTNQLYLDGKIHKPHIYMK